MKNNRVCMCIIATLILSVTGCEDTSVPGSGPETPEDPDIEVDYEFQRWALTPPMGWNSYDCYGSNVTEEQVRVNAKYLADNLKRYGWEYVVIDARWFVTNQLTGNYNTTNPDYVLDKWGRHFPAENRFPSSAWEAGFRPLANYIHGLGLKFGIHIMRGIPVEAVNRKLPVKGADGITADMIYSTSQQCQWLADNYTIVADKPGAQEYYDSIFELYAFWGVDYVKVDDISRPYHSEEIEMIRKAIDKTGRNMVLSLSPGATSIVNADHAKEHANLWRLTDDVWDRWGDMVLLLDTAGHWAPHIGPGHWPDADMIPFGWLNINNHMAGPRFCRFNRDAHYTFMSLLIIMRSPLMFGGNLPNNGVFTSSFLTNEEALYITKKSTNNRELYNNHDVVAWAADDMASDDKFLALFFCGNARPGYAQLGGGNRTDFTQEIDDSGQDNEKRAVSVDLTGLGFTGKVKVRDIWHKQNIGEFSGEEFAPEITLYGAGLYRLSPAE